MKEFSKSWDLRQQLIDVPSDQELDYPVFEHRRRNRGNRPQGSGNAAPAGIEQPRLFLGGFSPDGLLNSSLPSHRKLKLHSVPE